MNSLSPEPKKSLGQHWLHDPAMLEGIIAEASLIATDTVVEVGPGLGTLTKPLTEQVENVIAVEYDEQLAADLPARVPASNLRVVHEDILNFDFSKMEPGYKVVANIPYYLTSHLIRRLLESENKPSVIVLLIQKEVAERIVAPAGSMSMLGVSAQFYADCSLGIVIPAEMFTPPPKVDSQVVALVTKTPPEVDIKSFFRVVKAGFSEKRKKLANSLSGGLGVDKKEVTALLSSLGFGENVRAQELTVEDWLRVHTAFSAII